VIANISHSRAPRRQLAFSLVEVVLALGVIAVGVIAILGAFPTALQTGHSAQDETRAAHISQSVFGSLVAGARTAAGDLNMAPAIPLTTCSCPSPAPTCTPHPTSSPINLANSSNMLYANNDGQLTDSTCVTDPSYYSAYAIAIFTQNSPPGFDPGANLVTVRVLSPPLPNQGPTPAPNQTYRDYVRIISKY